MLVSDDFPGTHDNAFTGRPTDAANTVVQDIGGASVQFDDVSPDIPVGKTIDPTGVFAPGEDVGFEIVVTNNSLEAMQSLLVRCRAPYVPKRAGACCARLGRGVGMPCDME